MLISLEFHAKIIKVSLGLSDIEFSALHFLIIVVFFAPLFLLMKSLNKMGVSPRALGPEIKWL